MDNYYSLLGCSEDASKDEIRKQYKQLALKVCRILFLKSNFIFYILKLHPDKNSSMDHLQFQQLSEAVNTLTDNKEKYKYDSELLGKCMSKLLEIFIDFTFTATRGSNKIITDEVNFEEFSLGKRLILQYLHNKVVYQ